MLSTIMNQNKTLELIKYFLKYIHNVFINQLTHLKKTQANPHH